MDSKPIWELYLQNQNAVVVREIKDCNDYLANYLKSHETEIWAYNIDLNALCDCVSFKNLYLDVVEKSNNKIVGIKWIINDEWFKDNPPNEEWKIIKYHYNFMEKASVNVKFAKVSDVKQIIKDSFVDSFLSFERYTRNTCFIFYAEPEREHPLDNNAVGIHRIYVPNNETLNDLRITIVGTPGSNHESALKYHLSDNMRHIFEDVFKRDWVWRNDFKGLVKNMNDKLNDQTQASEANGSEAHWPCQSIRGINDIDKTENNFWYRPIDSDKAIVMVHGFVSNNKKCWYNKKQNVYWPKLIAQDIRLKDYGILLAGYSTRVRSGNRLIQNCADDVFDYLKDKLRDKSNIIFIAHSLGGVVIKKVISDNPVFFSEKKIGFLLLGVPSKGSKLANRTYWFTYLLVNRMARQLGWKFKEINDYHKEFLKIIKEHDDGEGNIQPATIRKFSAFEVSENKWTPIFNPIPFPKLPVVSEKSAATGEIGEVRNPADLNHFTLSTPESENNPVHKLLIKLEQWISE